MLDLDLSDSGSMLTTYLGRYISLGLPIVQYHIIEKDFKTTEAHDA